MDSFYAFDVLMTMYEDQGYAKREAANSIIQNNLFGLEIDRRAFQLSYFSLMMKLRRYDRQALNRSVMPNIHVFIAAPAVTEEFLHSLKASSEVIDEIQDIAAHFMDAKTLGSIIELPANYDYAGMRNALEPVATAQKISLFGNQQTAQQLLEIIATAETMTQRYDVVVTNPPYLNKMNSTLKKYVKKHYKDYSADLFSVFIWHNINMTKVNGYAGYMTPFVWMFIKSYEKLRTALLSNVKIDSLIQLEYSAFEEATVPINTFVLKNTKNDETGTYLRLSDFKGGMMIQAEKVQEAIADPGVKYLYRTNQTIFNSLPGQVLSYWLSSKIVSCFDRLPQVQEYFAPKVGIQTGDNTRFYKNWYEISTESPKNWVKANKNGDYRRWYGNCIQLIDWSNSGQQIKEIQQSVVRNEQFYFREGVSWSNITSSELLSARYIPKGMVFDQTVPMMFEKDAEPLFNILGFLNSKVALEFGKAISPTMHFNTGELSKYPYRQLGINSSITDIVSRNVDVCRYDWDTQEISWSFSCSFWIQHIAEHTVLVICHIHRRISKIRVTAKHPFKKLATWWHKIQNVPKKCQTFGLGGH
ncbi:BREX-1 system adenine-specific DNA-methyltransferase PglX [Lentilactobacillus buchneri]|uniref:BREX-1 system adenine-specific DNA-methyltransferase PglX n=1 Tax=Lentilactobacillus buchneri TaxID=1581 RepID=UPI0021A48F28|nr:BREX-1 system adenine-specific DNA-methyltransferase PglX [Lentilactobacillus buchneri]